MLRMSLLSAQYITSIIIVLLYISIYIYTVKTWSVSIAEIFVMWHPNHSYEKLSGLLAPPCSYVDVQAIAIVNSCT